MIGQWRAREPEMVFAESFCPPPLRTQFRIWGALLMELRQAAFELSDARVIEAKSAWWAEELARSAQYAARHPLTQALVNEAALHSPHQQVPLPWAQLGNGLLVSATSEPRPVDCDAAIAGMRPLAEGMLGFESALFGAAALETRREPAECADASNAVVAHLLGERLRVGLGSDDGGRIPLALLARHHITAAQLVEPAGAAAVAEWAQQLLTLAPVRRSGTTLYRHVRSAFDRRALQRIAQQRPPTPARPLAALWLAWRAARRGSQAVLHKHNTPTL